MFKTWSLVATLVALMLAAFGVADGSAIAQQPITPESPVLPGEEGAMPPLEGGAPYSFPIVSSEPHSPERPNSASELTINVWYGAEQAFGQLGTPQQWLNILGSVSGPQPIVSLVYSLNGGPEIPLSIGTDKMRLYGSGDFNIELDITAVTPLPGTNTITIKANDGQSTVETAVTVTYDDSTTWPLPYVADWSAVASVQAAGQVVDGLWELNNGALENVMPGFDRLVAIGDMSWTEYEVTVPVTVHTLNSGEWTGPSNGGGVGIIVRWPGHYNIAGEQPALGWRHLGALGWYHWGPKGDAGFELRGEGGVIIDSSTDTAVALGVPYLLKMRVEALDGPTQPATYSFKFWEASATEPAEWTMQARGRTGEPLAGSVVLVAHQSEVTFGDVVVTPLNFDGLHITVDEPENGTIAVEPSKAAYQIGEQVTVEAIPNEGFEFTGWTGGLSGLENPATITLTGDMTVGATFTHEPYRVFISPVASGTVNGTAFQAGDVLAYDEGGQWVHLLSSGSGPLGEAGDIEAFSMVADGSMLLTLARKQNIDGLGEVRPNDVLRVYRGISGTFADGTVEMYLRGADAGLTSGGERIDALTLDAEGWLLITTIGTAKVKGPSGENQVVRNEDILRLGPALNGQYTWELVCDGSLVPGMASEAIEGLSIDPAGGGYLLSFHNGFTVGGVTGTTRDIVSISACSPTAEVALFWNAQNEGFGQRFDAFDYWP